MTPKQTIKGAAAKTEKRSSFFYVFVICEHSLFNQGHYISHPPSKDPISETAILAVLLLLSIIGFSSTNSALSNLSALIFLFAPPIDVSLSWPLPKLTATGIP